MKISDFEIKLKEIDPRLSIVPNPNYPGKLCNVKLDGIDICPVPADEIKEVSDPMYSITFNNGWMQPHNSIEEVMGHINRVKKLLETKEGEDDFYGR